MPMASLIFVRRVGASYKKPPPLSAMGYGSARWTVVKFQNGIAKAKAWSSKFTEFEMGIQNASPLPDPSFII